MADKPILFSGEMVRAILDGKKTQTRRVIKDLPDNHPDGLRDAAPAFFEGKGWYLPTAKGYKPYYCNPRDLLWVRESWQAQNVSGQWWHEGAREERPLHHWAFTNPVYPAFNATPPRWLPSIHMPRLASRIELRVTDVRVEQVQDISEADALAEGVKRDEWLGDPVGEFAALWESINGPRGFGWDANPWVWVVEFELLR